MTIKNIVADGISRSKALDSGTFERVGSIQDACTACESRTTSLKPSLMEVNRKIQQHSNTQTQVKKTYSAQSAATLSQLTEKKNCRSFELILRVENSDNGLANSMDIKNVRQTFPRKTDRRFPE